MVSPATTIATGQAKTEDALLKRMGYRDPDLTRRLLRHDPAAGHAANERALALAREGIRRRAWTPTAPKSPGVRRDGPYRYWDMNRIAGWHDHPYRLVAADGAVIFVSEPYALTKTGLANLLRLEADGWHLLIRPEYALHFPGQTMAVWLRREPWGLG
jgi:hypothetical protein